MANKAISELPQAQNVNNQDLFVLEQSGIAKKLTAETFITEQGIIDALAEALDGHGGISSVTLSSVSGRIRTYLITFTDETTTTFQVYDGTSIDRIVKTSTAGLTDTYTVFMNDGSTTFFQVTNGSKGDTGYPTDEQVATAVNTWLDNNVTPGTGAVLDRTLTMSNAAAPADLVGDIKKSIIPIPFTLAGSGYIDTNDGLVKTSSQTSHTDYIDISNYKFILYKRQGSTSFSVSAGVAFYDVNKTYISGITSATGRSATGYVDGLYATIPPTNAVYARFNAYTNTTTYGDFALYGASEFYELSSHKISVPIFEGTSTNYSYGNTTSSKDGFWKLRSVQNLISVNGNYVLIKINLNDLTNVQYFNIYEYSEVTEGNVSFITATRNLAFNSNGEFAYSPPPSTKYIKIVVALSNENTKKYRDLELISDGALKLFKLPNIPNPDVLGPPINVNQLSFAVSGTTYSCGQLLLPPNYSIHGDPVPLIVVLHGTSSMNTWTEAIGSNSGTSTRPLLDYLTNEGFAVFDCYPFTSKYYKSSEQIACAPVPVFKETYEAGIKFVCDRFNVDIDRICMYAMSLGGVLGYMFLHGNNTINPKAIAMLAPTTGYASLIFRTFFLEKSGRQFVVDYLGLNNETGADTFINTNQGLDDATARQFVEDHQDEFAGFICGAIGVDGATYKDQYDWMMTGETTLPQWMTDLSLPSIPSGWSSGVPSLINHPDLTSYTPIAVKFWQAFDDVNVSGHANYTIYNWLKNGGTNVQWRTLPNNTGGHHAVDTDANALVSSGTTRLGISYSNIATAYVEMADFFYKTMGE